MMGAKERSGGMTVQFTVAGKLRRGNRAGSHIPLKGRPVVVTF